MKKRYFTVFDLETGGFHNDKHAITEGAFIVYDGATMQEVYRYSDLVKPYAGLGHDQQALDATGITLEMIEKDGVSIQTFVKNVINVFEKGFGGGKGKWKRNTILVGHNIDDFDIGFLSIAFQVVGADILDYVDETTHDTLHWSRIKWMNEGGKFNLTACCERAGIELIDAHRAMNDAEATMKLHQFFISCLRSEGLKVENKEEKFRETFKF